jgi:hypothetical protein
MEPALPKVQKSDVTPGFQVFPELKAGSRLDLRGISVCEFSGGKIVRLSDYS